MATAAEHDDVIGLGLTKADPRCQWEKDHEEKLPEDVGHDLSATPVLTSTSGS